MWGEPRKGTEAYKVKQLAEARSKEAKAKGYDGLLVDLFFERLKSLAERIKIGNGWEKYKHPEIENLKESNGNKNNDYRIDVTFDFRDKSYSLQKSRELSREYGDDSYCYLDLYIAGKKAFGLMVNVDSNQYTTNYSPSLITAYANNDWVSDFQEIKAYYENASKASEIAYAEDPEKTKKLMEEFGIYHSDLQEGINSQSVTTHLSSEEEIIDVAEKKPFWKKWWFWVIVIYLVLVSVD